MLTISAVRPPTCPSAGCERGHGAAGASQSERTLDADDGGVGACQIRGVGDGRRLRVLEAVARKDADGAPAAYPPRARLLQEPGDAGRACRLDEQALLARKELVGLEDLGVSDGIDQAFGFVAGGGGALPARGIADADGGGDSLGVRDRLAADDRRGAGGLEAPHARVVRGAVYLGGEREAAPVGGDIAGVAHGDRENLGRVAERLADLE